MTALKCWRLPIVTGRCQPSIFGTSELNFRVRDGNGWTLTVISTNCFVAFRDDLFILSLSATKSKGFFNIFYFPVKIFINRSDILRVISLPAVRNNITLIYNSPFIIVYANLNAIFQIFLIEKESRFCSPGLLDSNCPLHICPVYG